MFNGNSFAPNFFYGDTVNTTAGQLNCAGICSASSVVAIKFDQGIIIAADRLVSYGSMTCFQDVDRIFKINENIILAGDGDFADVQHIKRMAEHKIIDDHIYADNMKPRAMASWLTKILYNRRCLMKPLFATTIIGGIEDCGTPYLGAMNMNGTYFEDCVVGTQFAALLATPLVREAKARKCGSDFKYDEAAQLIQKSMEVLYYRHKQSISKYNVGICTSTKCCVAGPFKVNENWTIADF